MDSARPVVLVTGVGRTAGIGAGIARQPAASGWEVGFSYGNAYDARMSWGVEPGATETIEGRPAASGASVVAVEADLADVAAPAAVFDAAGRRLGPARRRAGITPW